jgi:hypothetical protein
LSEQLLNLYLFLNTPQNSFNVFVGFAVLALVALVLRIAVCIGYQMQLALFQLNAKEIKSKREIKDTHSAFLNRAVKDYIRTCDKNISPRSARDVVDKHLNRLSILGWNYGGISAFITSVEGNIVFIGIILAVVFEDFRYAFAVGAVAAFVLARLLGAIFDYTAVRERLAQEASEYIDREIGQFYAGDLGSHVTRLKSELASAILGQSVSLGDAIEKMGIDISGVMRLGLQEMGNAVDSTMLRVSDFGGELSVPLDNWKKAVAEAAAAQDRFGTGLASFENTSNALQESAMGLSGGLSGHAEAVRAQSGLIRDEIAKLAELTATLKDASIPLLSQGDGIGKQLSYIERNQETLELSLQRFELIMEDMTRKLGDGFGSMIDYHIQNSYSVLNSALEDNIRKIVTANNELAERMQRMTAEVYEQSRSESQAIIKVKEQMDLHFENLNNPNK